MTETMTPWYAVIGDPIAHSKSPEIHALFSEQTGIPMRYTRIRVPADEFELRMHEMIAHGLGGASITVPHKLSAFQFATEATKRATIAESANLLTIVDNRITADNTDGIGIVTDIENNNAFSLTGRRILVLGAGGAVRGVLGSLIGRKPASVTIVNRTYDKARELARRFSLLDSSVRVDSRRIEEASGVYDCIINGTSASLSGQSLPVSSRVFEDCPLVYDMMYASTLTSFLQTARESGAMTVRDGLGMLVEQAAEQFLIWHGVRPETLPVLAALRSKLTA